MENSETEQKSERRTMDHENRFGEHSDSIKCNIHIIEVPEEEEERKEG